jgi:chromate transporter
MISERIVDLLLDFVPLSLTSIGGGQAVLGDVERSMVDQHQWLTRDQFLDDFAISRASPGPNLLLIPLLGWHVAGLPGAIAAGVGMFLPSSLLFFFAARLWRRHHGSRWHAILSKALTPIAAGLVLAGPFSVLRASEAGPWGWGVALASMALLVTTKIHPLIVLGAGAAFYDLVDHLGLPI